MKCCFVLGFTALIIASCSDRVYLRKIDAYLNASSPETKARYMSNDYRSWFMVKNGEGNSKAMSLQSFINWDAALHPDVAILQHSRNGTEWQVYFNEQNDFSKAIDFPGWKGTELIRFNSKKKITEVIYIPDSTNPSYNKWLNPATDWLKKNRPDDLDQVYKDGSLVQSFETARKWIDLLQTWRRETGREK